MLSLGSTTARYDNRVNRYEPDSSFRDFYAPEYLDEQGHLVPSIIIEIGYSENVISVFDTAKMYMRNEHVQLVISIKLYGKHKKVNHLFSFVHERTTEGPRLVSAISFGQVLTGTDKTEILNELRDEGVELVEVQAGDHAQINHHDDYSIIISRSALWKEAEDAMPANASNHRIYLCEILETLRDTKNLGEGFSL
jgi:hypothetical protein